MYSVGGNTYAGKGLSGYYLTDGDTLYLRFTLAYGKDIGGYSSTGGSYGLLPSYCGKWLNGTYIEEHVWGEPTQTVAPDCTHPARSAPSAPSAAIGRISRRCRLWGMISWRRDARSRERTEHRATSNTPAPAAGSRSRSRSRRSMPGGSPGGADCRTTL